MMDRRAIRRLFVTAFRACGMEYADGGWLVRHPEISWTVSLVVDGRGREAPYRLILGASVHELGPQVPTSAEDCYMFFPLPWPEGSDRRPSGLVMPDEAFPDWRGPDEARRNAIESCVSAVAEYTREVDSLEDLRKRYESGDYDGAFIILPMRVLLERQS